MEQHFFFVKKNSRIIWAYLPGPYTHLCLYQAQSWYVSYTSPVHYRALPWIFLVFGNGPRFRRLFADPNLKRKKNRQNAAGKV